MSTVKTTSLVLGSGGAKGLTHVGVIRCLEERGYDVRYVAGSSIGALVGGVYAAGEMDAFVDWVSALQRTDIVRLLDWSFDGGALFKGDRVIAALRDLVGEHDIEDLAVRYTAVATDLSESAQAREVWFNHGPLFDAIRASIAVPTLFEPVLHDGRQLVDGGVVNPVPVAPTLNNNTRFTVAVDLNGMQPGAAPLPKSEGAQTAGALRSVYQQSIGRYVDRFWPDDESTSERLGFSDVAMRSMEVMQATLTQFKLAATAPTVTISMPRNLCGFFDFYRADDLIAYGYERASETLAQLESRSSDPID